MHACHAGSLAAYTQLLLVPLMARMSDPLPVVRRTASPTFAALVALVPLAQVSAHPMAAHVVLANIGSERSLMQTTTAEGNRHAVDGLQRLCQHLAMIVCPAHRVTLPRRACRRRQGLTRHSWQRGTVTAAS